MDKSSPNYIALTKGGAIGYWWRRAIHVSIAILPILYYHFGETVASWFGLPPVGLLLLVIALDVVVEALRLYFGVTVWGHREYETTQISSLAWGVLSICVVLLLAPPEIAVPIIWGCAFVDPLLGELRRFNLSSSIVAVIGLIALLIIWWIGTLWLGTSWWYALILAPIALVAEWPSLKWVDDNATMQLVPLVFAIFLYYLF